MVVLVEVVERDTSLVQHACTEMHVCWGLGASLLCARLPFVLKFNSYFVEGECQGCYPDTKGLFLNRATESCTA